MAMVWQALDYQVDVIPYLTLFIVVLSPFLFRPNSTLHFQGKFIFYYLFTSTIALLLIPVFLFTPKDVGNSRRSTYITRHVAKVIGIDYELRNGQILAEERGAFVVSNHQSTLDILGLFNIWVVPNKVAAIAKKEIFYVWPFGLSAWLAGVVFIDRSSPKKAYDTLKETTKVIDTDKTKIWVFPEGTRNKDANKTKTLLSFKKGAFKMAIDCQAPIIPVVFSPYYFLNEKTNYFGQGKIIIKALPAIETKGLKESDVDDLINKTNDLMQKTYQEFFAEIEATLPKTHPYFDK